MKHKLNINIALIQTEKIFYNEYKREIENTSKGFDVTSSVCNQHYLKSMLFETRKLKCHEIVKQIEHRKSTLFVRFLSFIGGQLTTQ